MVELKFYSFNVRGIRDPLKRKIIFRHLTEKYPGGIYFLQETHSSPDIVSDFYRDWNVNESSDRIHFSHGKTDSCGVAVLISADLDLNITLLHRDDEGRFLVLKLITNDNQEFIACNLYCPTRNKVKEQLTFFDHVKQTLANFDYVNLIMGGDYNSIFNVELDKQGGNTENATNEFTEELKAFMEANDLVDAYRIKYPDRRTFTRFQRKPPVMTRIDHWLISSHLINYMKDVDIYPGIKSDHSIIFLSISNTNTKQGRGFWKFNTTLLKDLEYVKSINEMFDSLKEETLDFNT